MVKHSLCRGGDFSFGKARNRLSPGLPSALIGKTRILELKDNKLNESEIAPEDFGLERCTLEEIKTGTPQENADIIRGVFSGKIKDARRNAVLLNAAGALIIGDKAADFNEGIKKVAEIIDSGAAEATLQQLIEKSNAFIA